MKWLKTYWFPVTIILVGIGAWAYSYFRKPASKLKFGFMSNNDLSGVLPMIQGRYAGGETEKGIGVYLDVPLTALVKNKGAEEIVLNNLAGTLSFEGENILQTKGDSTKLKTVNVAGKSNTPVTDTFQVLVNGKTIKYIKEVIAGGKPKLGYNLSAMVAGDVYNFRDSTVLNADIPS